MERFKEKFINEAHDLINNLETFLLDLENNQEDEEIIQQIFRVMHTLKGVSGMYGFDGISDITHHLESIYDKIRNHEEKLTESIFNVTLETVDHLRNLLADEQVQVPENQTKQSYLLGKIQNIFEKEINASVPEPKEILKPKESEIIKQYSTYYVIFKPNEGMLFRRISILALFEELCELGQYEVIRHNFREEDTDAENAWGIYVATDQGPSAIEDVFVFVLDDCKVLKISDQNLFNYDEFRESLRKINDQKEQSISSEIEKITQFQEDHAKPDEKFIEKQKEKLEEKKEKNMNLESIGQQITSRVHVDSSKLDKLMYLVSELVTTKAQISLMAEQKDYIRLNALVEKLDDLSRQFRDNTLSIRLVPVLDMIMPFKRLIRDLSKDLEKEVRFITEGTDTELDKNMIDRLAEPIMHIIRNCIDHGIETPAEREKLGKPAQGTIRFSSYYSGANVYIQIQDDGAGIDPKKVIKKAIENGLVGANDQLSDEEVYELLFKPGFSTAKNVTEISGRGVGMDIVKKKIGEIRGEVEVDSELGHGTTFTIKLNQTISIIDTLLVKVSESHFLIPLNEIEICEQEANEVLFQTQNKRVEINQELIPFIYLRNEFHINGNIPGKEKLIIINKNNQKVAVVADKIIGEHQAVLKPLGEMFKSQEFLSGASILGDGNLALMLDTNKLMKACLS
jgi:two-component system chemotaxis sensor kinase CheA